jgi:3-hydroxyacyl-CoA dehydrogenase
MLESGDAGKLRYQAKAGVATITLCSPPVNSFSLALRRKLLAALARAKNDASVQAVILTGDGKGFSAGGDIKEFGTPEIVAEPRLTIDLHPFIETLGKPVVAALHGYALGGGFETAMACHGIVACADTKIALPEVNVGVIPLSGTQRLPRYLGMRDAAEMILSGQRRIAAAFPPGLFNEIVPAGDIENLALAASRTARAIAAQGAPYPMARNIELDLDDAIEALTRVQSERAPLSKAGAAAIAALKAAAEAPDFDAGLQIANLICEELLDGLGKVRS